MVSIALGPGCANISQPTKCLSLREEGSVDILEEITWIPFLAPLSEFLAQTIDQKCVHLVVTVKIDEEHDKGDAEQPPLKRTRLTSPVPVEVEESRPYDVHPEPMSQQLASISETPVIGLNYYALGDQRDRVCLVELPASARVHDLMEAIKTRRPNFFQKVDIANLNIYKVSWSFYILQYMNDLKFNVSKAGHAAFDYQFWG